MARKKRKNPAPKPTPWLKYALIAGGAYLILRELRKRGTLGNGGYGVKPVDKPKPKPKTMVGQFTASLPWYARAALTVAEAGKDVGTAAKSLVLPGSVAPDWKSANADLIERLREAQYAKQKAAQQKPLFTLEDVKNVYGAAEQMASSVKSAYDIFGKPKYTTLTPLEQQITELPAPRTLPYGPEDIAHMRKALTKGQDEPIEEKEMARQAEEILESYATAEKDASEEERIARIRERNEELDRQKAEGQLPWEEYVKLKDQQLAAQGLPPAPEPEKFDWDRLVAKGKEALVKTFAPEAASKEAQAEIVRKLGDDTFNPEELKRIGASASQAMTSGLDAKKFDTDNLKTDPNVKKEIGGAVGLTAMEILMEKAGRNELSVDTIINLDKAGASELPKPVALAGDANTLANMRALQKLKPKLDEETFKVQEEGYAPSTVNGKTVYNKIDLNKEGALETWRKQRAEELVSAYQEKMKPRLEAEQKATDEFIAKRSPVVAKAKDLITKGIIDKAPRMTPTGSDKDALKEFQQKYGDNPGHPNSELTTDSYMRLISDYADQMKNKLSSGGSGAATEGALPFILNDLKGNIGVMMPVFTQAADPTLDQNERFDRLKKFASALDAVTAEMAAKSVPKYLATKSDSEVLTMLNQGVASNLSGHLQNLRQKRLESAPIVIATESTTVQGLDGIAAMEFGPRKRRRLGWMP